MYAYLGESHPMINLTQQLQYGILCVGVCQCVCKGGDGGAHLDNTCLDWTQCFELYADKMFMDSQTGQKNMQLTYKIDASTTQFAC